MHDRQVRVAVTLAVCLAALVGVGVLIGKVVVPHVADADLSAVNWLYHHAPDGLRSAMKRVTHLGSTPVIIAVGVLLVVVAVRRGDRAAALAVVVAIAGGYVLFHVIKPIVDRPRPPHQVVRASGQSFPSGHATSSMVTYGMLAVLAWRWWSRRVAVAVTALAVLVVVVVAFSRVVLSVHYPSDVITGWLLGGCWLAAVVVVLLPPRAGAAS